MRWTICLALLLSWLPQQANAAIKIGYINLREALNSVDDGKQAKAVLKKKKARFQKMLNREQTKLKKAKSLFDRRQTLLRGPAKQRERLKLQKKFFKLQKTYTSLTRKLAREEALATRKIFRKMEIIIRAIARDYSLTLMLEKTESSILFATRDMDYTAELIRRYNKRYAKGNRRHKRRKRKRRRRRKRR